MSLHAALCSIPLNLIYNMTMFWKKKLDFDPTPGPRGGGSAVGVGGGRWMSVGKIYASMLLHLRFA